MWRTPKADDPNHGAASDAGMRRRIEKGHSVRLQDQVNHPALFRTPDAGCSRGVQSKERFAESQEAGRLLTLNDQIAHLWPTPKASDAVMGMTARTSGRPLEKSTHLQARVYCAEMFPTPRAADAEKGTRSPEGAMKEISRGHGIDLPSHAQIFPTPTVCGNNNRKGASGKSGDGLATFAKREAGAIGGLNPEWVGWLMGFPAHWTDLDRKDQCVKEVGQNHWGIEPGIPRTVKRAKNRKARLRALGNAVVPAQAYPIFKAISMIEEGRDINET